MVYERLMQVRVSYNLKSEYVIRTRASVALRYDRFVFYWQKFLKQVAQRYKELQSLEIKDGSRKVIQFDFLVMFIYILSPNIHKCIYT